MNQLTVSINSIDKVKEFVDCVRPFPFDMDLTSGRYVIDAKSIMGIFSLDISKPIELICHTSDEEQMSSLKEALKDFLI